MKSFIRVGHLLVLAGLLSLAACSQRSPTNPICDDFASARDSTPRSADRMWCGLF